MRRSLERQRIVRDFLAAGATRPDRAIDYVPRHRRMFGQLRAFGAIVVDEAGRCHLDGARLARFGATVRRRTATAAASGLIAAIAALCGAFDF